MSAAKNAIHLADASRIIGTRLNEWPAEFMPAVIAAFLAGGSKGASKDAFLQWLERLRGAVESAPPLLVVRTVRKPPGEPWAKGRLPKPWGLDAFGCTTFSEDRAKTRYWVSAPALAEWLISIEHSPPEYLRAWLDANGVPVPQVGAGEAAIVDGGGTVNAPMPKPLGDLPTKPATQEQIELAFQIEGGWGDKLKKAPSGTYKWLAGTWIRKGTKTPGNSTTYNPAAVAAALVLTRRMTFAACDSAIRNYFSEWLDEWESKADYLK
jgi:hypothetical protein